MRRMDPQSGKPSTEDPRLYSLASRERPRTRHPIPPGCPVTGKPWKHRWSFVTEITTIYLSLSICAAGE